jgi:hypothetical protein
MDITTATVVSWISWYSILEKIKNYANGLLNICGFGCNEWDFLSFLNGS